VSILFVVLAAGATDARAEPFLTLRPALIEAKDSSGTTLGLNYELNKQFKFWQNSTTSVGSDVVPADSSQTPLHGGLFLLKGQGTVTASRGTNPNKLLDLSADLSAHRSGGGLGYTQLGAVGAFETDQGFEHKQSLLGLSVSHTLGYFGLGLTYAEVKPNKDADRQKLVGNLDKFKRWNAEFAFSMPIHNPYETANSSALVKIRSIEAGYRHYQEIGAPSAIKTAGKDRNRLGLVRLNLDGDFFLQYSKGSLPFDKKGERAWQVGWTSKFE
jgi:hypothetical protein